MPSSSHSVNPPQITPPSIHLLSIILVWATVSPLTYCGYLLIGHPVPGPSFSPSSTQLPELYTQNMPIILHPVLKLLVAPYCLLGRFQTLHSILHFRFILVSFNRYIPFPKTIFYFFIGIVDIQYYIDLRVLHSPIIYIMKCSPE